MEELFADSYHEAEAFLAEVPKFTKKNLFEDTQAFYEYIQACDNGRYSEKNLGRIIHVAGTNGKGSVCAFLQQICIESGYKTGMFTSPHLVTTRERFHIDGNIISEETFVEAFNWLTKTLRAYATIKAGYKPTYFERLFFMGMYIFTKAGVEVTVLETGLGGRLDTTNVIKSPVLTIITEIGLDHMEYLGNSITEIAKEKAGIIKTCVPVVFMDRKKEASAVICKKAADFGCKCCSVSENDYKINEIQKKYIDFFVVSSYYGYCGLKACTTAAYQAENAALAVKACEVLERDCGFQNISLESVKMGISKMRWAGRMEEVASGVYIDGAHNEDGIEAFVKSVNSAPRPDICEEDRCLLIFSVVKDKQYDKMIEMLCKLNMVTDFVVTHIPGGRGAELAQLRELFRKHTDKPIHTYEKIEDALRFSVSVRGMQGVVYIVGSLYLAGIVELFFDNRV